MAKLETMRRPAQPPQPLRPHELKVGEVYIMRHHDWNPSDSGQLVMCVNNYRFEGYAIAFLAGASAGEVVVLEKDDSGTEFFEVERPRVTYNVVRGL